MTTSPLFLNHFFIRLNKGKIPLYVAIDAGYANMMEILGDAGSK